MFTVKVNKQVDLTLKKLRLVNSVKRTNASLLIVAFSLLVILPVALPTGTVSAQTSSYSIDRVDHQVQVMYSGHVVILDTIHISGQVTDGFMIGLPYNYSADVLKGFAYDDTHVYRRKFRCSTRSNTADSTVQQSILMETHPAFSQ